MYGAYYLPNGELNKEGFKTEQEAWEYIVSFNCDSCEGIESACAAEWIVDEVEEHYGR